MALRDKISKGTKTFIFFVLVNQLFNPLIQPFTLNHLVKEKRTNKLNIPDEKYGSFVLSDDSLNARDYLNFANSIVNQYSHNLNACLDFADSTYDLYHSIIQKNDRQDLSDKIRISVTSFGKSKHMWLDIMEDGKWEPYETTHYTPILTEEGLKEYSKTSRTEKSHLSGMNLPEFVTIKGKDLFRPTGYSLIAPGGVIGGFYRSYDLEIEEILAQDK